MRASAVAPALFGVAVLLALWAGGCATNPATGESELSLVSEAQERQIGQEAAQQLEASGALYEDADLTRYVNDVGRQLAAKSERPDLAWSFGVLDDTAINAFALPGGHIYLTRGILAHFVNEAQLAAVLGHEIGHVTARHHASQATQAQLAQLGLGIGSLISPELRGLGGLAETGLTLLLLRNSREAEREADLLGLRYMRRSAYEPDEMIAVMEMLDRTAEDSGGLPGWLSTHPAPQDRIGRIRSELGEDGGAVLGSRVEREGYLARLEGMVYGPDPERGVVVGEHFVHPGLDFQLRFPPGWRVLNQPEAVLSHPAEQDAMVALTLASETSLDAAAGRLRAAEGVRFGAEEALELSGLPARALSFSGQTQQGDTVRGTVVLVAHGGRVFELIGYAPDARWGAYEAEAERAMASFARLDPRYRDLEPRRIQVLAVERTMTLREFDERHPSSVTLEELARINQVSAATRLAAGTRVKRVLGGEAPAEREPVDPILGRPRADASPTAR